MGTAAAPVRPGSIGEDGSHRRIHPADVRGRFTRAREVAYLALLAFYLALPFVRIGGHPAVHLDVEKRRFHLFGAVFNAQDFWVLVLLLLAFALALLLATAWLGRVWCGWACPQTVFLEGVYRRIERWVEGPRESRRRLDEAEWSAGKLARKALKHALFLAVSLLVAHAALALFVSLPSVREWVFGNPREHWTAFAWTTGLALALYFNFAFFREQMCLALCPYGRLQSALVDRDTVTVGYDERRGEPRAKVRRGAQAAGGDCVDCLRCVVVCPTGIDIRDGQQLECIACAQCIDACDEVMVRLGRAPGLVRYDSTAGFEGAPRRVARPRLFAYGLALALVLAGLVWAVAGRAPFEANLLRVRGAPWVVSGDVLRNQFELHLVNKNPGPTVMRVKVEAPVPVQVTLPASEVRLEPLAHYRLPVVVAVRDEDFRRPFEIEVEVEDEASSRQIEVTGRFLGPVRGP